MLVHSGGAFAAPDAVKAAALAALAREAQANSLSKQTLPVSRRAMSGTAAAAAGAVVPAQPAAVAPQPGHSSSQAPQPSAVDGKGRKRLAEVVG